VHLLLENEENDASRLRRAVDGRPTHYTAQWNDDVHHVLHTAATGESSGYYADYVGKTDLLARSLAEGFAFQGQMMNYRGHPRGEPSAHLPPTAFVTFIQNHDQVGNRAFGDRISALIGPEILRVIAATYLLAPQIPLIFMGEEWGTTQPFPFFCDFEPELAEAVRNGRRAEFAKFPEFQDPEERERIPDPTSRDTFLSAKLNWEDLRERQHSTWLEWYRRVLSVRHTHIIPRLQGIEGNSGTYKILGDSTVHVRWILGDGSNLVLVANLRAEPFPLVRQRAGRVIWSEGLLDETLLGPWSAEWSLEAKS
jgi:maltooligosyltrehalose trehalohydrolase